MEISRLFSLPEFADEERTRRAQVLRFVIWSLLLVFDTQFFVFFFLLPQHWQRWLGILLTFNFTLPPLLLLSRRGRTRMAGTLLMTMLWTLATVLALTALGIHAMAVVMFIVFVLIAGLLFGERGGIKAGIIFGLTALSLVLVEMAGLLPSTRIKYTALSIWVLLAMCLEFIAIFQFLANRSIMAALKQANESEQRYREVFETTSDCIFLMDVTPDGRFLSNRYNPATEKVIGFPSVETSGKPPDQIFPSDLSKDIMANLQRCVAKGMPTEYEEKITSMRGESFFFYTTLIPVRNEEGRIYRIVGVARDITYRKQAEAALRESEQRYREVYENAADGIFLYDVTTDGRYIGYRLNPTYEKMLGFTSAEFVGRTPDRVLGPDAARALIAYLNRCVAQGTPLSAERIITSLSGQSFHLHTTFIPVKNAEGRVHRMVGVSHDITERKKAEDSLRESEQRYREVFENTSDCMFLMDVTSDGRFLCRLFNPAEEHVFGITSAEIAGKTPEELLSPDEARAVTANYQRCVDQGSSVEYEETLTTRSGKSSQFHTTLIPVRNAEGRIFRIVGVARNITEQKKAEAALRESEQRYGELYETTSDSIFMLDVTADGRFLSYRFNPAAEKVIGFKSAEVAGKELGHFFPPDLAKTLNANYQRCVEKGSPIEYEEKITSLGGQSYYFYTTLIPVKNDQGRVFRIAGVAHDITLRKEREATLRRSRDELEMRVKERTAELEKVNKELEAFSYSVSHDLRRPLRTVTGFTDLLMEDYARDLPADAQNLLSMTRESAVQMNQLIDALLNLSRIEREPLVPRPVNLAELARQTARELRAEHPDRNIDICVANLPECMGDPALLRQVFVNLLSNAIKFTRNRPVAVIEVSFETEDGKTVYFVRDNGAGFDMSQADKLFGVFQRLHSATEFGGTGVGLTIVRRIVHRHGGTIWAEAEVDKGATFYFTIPGSAQDDGRVEGTLKFEHEAG